ncbi:hypothetical protein RVF83_13670 [Gordonia rubripertincta]|uniref:Uncharacterized protein n=1 Tax=Gordonia rubripertincta TaxID=36822 RepID=A0AAW6R789_GORRU|nr:hypothetical protein [Gordonia rubripertincta]MDG6780235.1 hypothetical protein [Gordonia rubripertincta]NKY63522.1 hypothetical protein [Gordonia rubripertincta]
MVAERVEQVDGYGEDFDVLEGTHFAPLSVTSVRRGRYSINTVTDANDYISFSQRTGREFWATATREARIRLIVLRVEQWMISDFPSTIDG